MRLVREMGIAVIAGAVVGIVVALSGKHVMAGLWVGLAVGVLLLLIARFWDMSQQVGALRTENAELRAKGALPAPASPNLFLGGTHYHGAGGLPPGQRP